MPLTRAEMARLVGALQSLTVSAPKSKKKRRRRRRASASQPAVGMPRPARSAPKRGAMMTGGDGQMTIVRDELISTITTDARGGHNSYVVLNPLTSSFPWLAGVSKSWERIVWHSASVSWRSMVGATKDGAVAYGADWTQKSSLTRAGVTALQPVFDHPVWQSTDARPMVLPPALLKSRLHYSLDNGDTIDQAPCRICINVSSAPANITVGELWLRYRVTLLGPRATSA